VARAQVAVRLSVIIPTLDEERSLAASLASAREADEVVVVDGGSTDRTEKIARAGGARVLGCERGRGRQLRRGLEHTDGDVVLFLHADTHLPAGFRREVLDLVAHGPAGWGRFDIRFDGGSTLVHFIARLISWRSRLTRVATGDQAIFARRELIERCGGLREDLLFEDIDLCRRLKREASMAVPRSPAVTSARRWRARGAWRTSFLMWGLKLLYLAGVPSSTLARFYSNVR